MPPATMPMIAPFSEWCRWYSVPASSAQPPVAQKCMSAPTQPLAGETSTHCKTLTTAVSSSPHSGPNRNVPIRIGTSAMSYSR